MIGVKEINDKTKRMNSNSVNGSCKECTIEYESFKEQEMIKETN